MDCFGIGIILRAMAEMCGKWYLGLLLQPNFILFSKKQIQLWNRNNGSLPVLNLSPTLMERCIVQSRIELEVMLFDSQWVKLIKMEFHNLTLEPIYYYCFPVFDLHQAFAFEFATLEFLNIYSQFLTVNYYFKFFFIIHLKPGFGWYFRFSQCITKALKQLRFQAITRTYTGKAELYLKYKMNLNLYHLYYF